jgi:DNA anti-recombination protein RmuC
MPDLDLPDLSKEIEVGGKSFPLWVPVGGAAIAVGLVLLSRLRGGGGATSEQAGDATGAFQAALGSLEGSLSERIAAAQAQAQEQYGEVIGLLGAQAGQISGLTGQIEAQAGQISGLQSVSQQQAGQIAGLSGQLGEQAAAFQAGLQGVQSSAQQLRADMNARIVAVETRVGKIETEGARLRKADRFSLAQTAWTLNRYIDETRMFVAGSTRLPGATIDAQGNVMYDTGAPLLRWS